MWCSIIDIPRSPHRVAVGATGRSPALHQTYPLGDALHNPKPRTVRTRRRQRGRASTRPYIACNVFLQINTSKSRGAPRSPYRVAVGATGRSPALHQIIPHLEDAHHNPKPRTVRTQRRQRGRASTRPYIACNVFIQINTSKSRGAVSLTYHVARTA